MKNEFKQITAPLDPDKASINLKVTKLLTLIQNHPYKAEVITALNLDSVMDDVINIENINSAFQIVKNFNEKFNKINLIAELKDVDINVVDSKDGSFLEFFFETGRVGDELKENLYAEGVYESKNSFFNSNNMTKYANHLYGKGFTDLISHNVQYFKKLASKNEEHNNVKSYRLLNKDDKYYLRGITTERYNEYGIDFTFFVTMILLHSKMKLEKGNNYAITNLSISESKLDMIIKDKRIMKVENFGNISTAIKVSTNELGNGSLNFICTLRVQSENDETLVYLFPRNKNSIQTKCVINHIYNLPKAMSLLEELTDMFDLAESYVDDIKNIKGIKTPDELRNKIQLKISHPSSVFKHMNDLKDIFKNKINNEINNFSKLLEMCKKAEQLQMEDYEIKDKLRYIISDIILYGNAK